MLPAPSMCLAAEEGTGGEGASGKRGDGPSALSRHGDNARKYPFRPFYSGATPIYGMAHNPRLRFQAKNLTIRAIHVNAAIPIASSLSSSRPEPCASRSEVHFGERYPAKP